MSDRSGRTYYDVLGIASTASSEDIVRAFRRLAVQFHPDHNAGPFAAEIFTKVTTAYRVLQNPERKAAYDASLTAHARTEQESAARAAWAAEQEVQRSTAAHARDRDLAAVREAKGRVGETFGKGFLWAAGGVLLTWLTYGAAQNGGYYFFFWGAVLFGAIQMLRSGYYYIRLWLIERDVVGNSLGFPRRLGAALVVSLGAIVIWTSGGSWPTSSTGAVLTTATPTPQSSTTRSSGQPATPFRFSLPPTTPPARSDPPTPVPTRAVLLPAEQMIMRPEVFPLVGYVTGHDEEIQPYGWRRQFTSTNRDYWWIYIDLHVYRSSAHGADVVAAWKCDEYKFVAANGDALLSQKEISAPVVGDGAKACFHHFGGNTADMTQYIAATRNVVVAIVADPRYVSNAQTLNLVVELARQQIGLISQAAPP
jgi:DnaJ domain